MVFAAFGGRRGPQMSVDETWIWMLIASMTMLVLLFAFAARRAAGVLPRQYPRSMFGLIIVVSIAATALAWVRLEGQISLTGWVAIGTSAATVTVAAFMLIPPRASAQ